MFHFIIILEQYFIHKTKSLVSKSLIIYFKIGLKIYFSYIYKCKNPELTTERCCGHFQKGNVV